MTAIHYDLYIDQGSDYTQVFKIQVLTDPSLPYDPTSNPYLPLDLTNYTATFQVESSYCSGTALLILTVGNGILLGGPLGTVSLVITGTQSAAMPTECGEYTEYFYQLELYSGGITARPVQGKFIISKEII